MNKAEYRVYFRIMSQYVKITRLLPGAKISQSNFSKFMNDDTGKNDDRVSIEKLDLLQKHARLVIEKIV